APDQNQNYDHQDHVDGPVVSSHIITRKYRLDSAVKVDGPKVSPNQLQPAVGGDVLGSKFDLQKALAWKKKIGSTQSHLEWPPCRVVWSVSQLLYLLQRAGHFKFFSPSFFVGLELTAQTSSGELPRIDAFRQGLRALGYVEGQNIAIDYRFTDGKL